MQKIAIVIPCYNEAERLAVDEFLGYYDRLPDARFCFVNDGSTDGTLAVLNRIQAGRERIAVLDLKKNLGKAGAVREGILYAVDWDDFDYAGYFDADFSTPLTEIEHFFKMLPDDCDAEVIAGSRLRRMGAHVERAWYRHYLGRIFSTLASIILRQPVYDTQCGAKLIRPELARKVFAEPFMTRWLFDVEMFARINKLLGHKRAAEVIFEVPLQKWIEKGGSKLSLKSLIRVPLELLKIYLKYR